MLDLSLFETFASTVPDPQLQELFGSFGAASTTTDRVAAVRGILRAAGPEWRGAIGNWIADLLSVEQLVPDAYSNWRPLVHECMAFVASRISDERLAPKLVEQLELPPDTSIESRLLLLIAKTPGLQKLGQVLARTRRLSPALRRELQTLENGISDMTAAGVREILERQLGPALRAYGVRIPDHLLSEASVSAIVEFTWENPTSGAQERGVFKVLKPHVPLFYSEDLQLLLDLAGHLAGNDGRYGFAQRQVSDTLEEVCLLLAHEVDFRREQVTLAEVARIYRSSAFRAPTPIPQLCTDQITAMSAEYGVKVTEAYAGRPALRRRVAAQVVEALIAAPMFSSHSSAMFHADPHAGNLLYDERAGQLIVLDWALTGRLTRDQRRHAARLIAAMTFRDAPGVREAIVALSSPDDRPAISRFVAEFFGRLPIVCSLGAMDAMRLLDRIGMEGVRFPAALMLLRKVMFTLDGVLNDIAGESVRIDTVVAREFTERLLSGFGRVPPPLTFGDYLDVQLSALRYAAGLWSAVSEPQQG